MISRTDRTIGNLRQASTALADIGSKTLSMNAVRKVNDHVRFTEEFQVDIPGEDSFVVVGLSPNGVRLSLEGGLHDRRGGSGTDISQMSVVELSFLAWLREQLAAWAKDDADLVNILERSKTWKAGAR